MAQTHWPAINAIGIFMLLCTSWHICMTYIRVSNQGNDGPALSSTGSINTTSLSRTERFEKKCREFATSISSTSSATCLYSWIDEHTVFDFNAAPEKIWYTWLTASLTHTNLKHMCVNFKGLLVAVGLIYHLKLITSAMDIATVILGSALSSSCVSAAVVKRPGAGASCIAAGVYVFVTTLSAAKMGTGPEEFVLTAVFGFPAVFMACHDIWHFRDAKGVGHAEHVGGAAFGLVYALGKLYGGLWVST